MQRTVLKSALLAAACLIAVPASADTLKEALARAYIDNPTIEAARATLRAIDENVPIQRSAGLPSLSNSTSYTEFAVQNGASVLSPDRSLSSSLDLSIPLFRGGAVRNGVLAAQNRIEAGRADLRGTESDLFSFVVSTYMDVILNEALVSLTSNNVEVLRINLEATSDRFEIGDLTRTDVAQSESRLAIARSDLRTAQANLVTARERYIELTGQAPGVLAPPPPLPGLPAEVDGAVATALDNNPDLIAARERSEALDYDIAVAGAGRLPRVDVFTGGGYQTSLGSSFGQPPGTTAQGGVRLTLPIFQGGLPAARQRQAQANFQAGLEQVVASERGVISQVRAAYSSWRASNAIIASTQTAVDAATLSLEGVRAENSVGNRTILDILDAQQELLRVQVQLVTARRNEYVAGFTLLAAMGRDEARDLGLGDEGPLYDPVANAERVEGIIWDWQQDADPVTQSSRTVDIPAQDADIPPSSQIQFNQPGAS